MINYLELKKITALHSEEIQKRLSEVVDCGWYLHGTSTKCFEDDFAKYIKQDLQNSDLLNSSNLQNKEEFYVSANPEQFKISAQMFYELKSKPELLTFKNLV